MKQGQAVKLGWARLAVLGVALVLAGCARPSASGTSVPREALPSTRAERSGYTETSTHADVVAFLDSLSALGAPIARGTMGHTTQGREIPYVIASRPLVRTPAEARALVRPVVYVQGNIHGGEVEGKESLQALLRDLVYEEAPNALDSIVLIAVPIYNADGNDAMGPQALQRASQNGPEMIGQRPNAQGFDLNRDYIKAEAPETRASLALFNEWNPDLFVDLHTTNGSYHCYAITYAPPLYPGMPASVYTRSSLLPLLRQRMQERHGMATFDYGNFNTGSSIAALTDTVKPGWYSYDYRPRFGTNYYALRGGVAILSEAYSHDPFERRVAATTAFVREILSLAAERGNSLRLVRDAVAAPATVPLRAALPETARERPVVYEVLVATGDSVLTEPGVPRGIRRSGRFITSNIPVFASFVSTVTDSLPEAFILSPDDSSVVLELRRHGVAVERLEQPWEGEVHVFVVDSVIRSPREFQQHFEMRVEGTARRVPSRTLPAGSYVVRGSQRLGALALVLLDPRSGDGLLTWNRFDSRLVPGTEFPVLQIRGPFEARGRPVP